MLEKSDAALHTKPEKFCDATDIGDSIRFVVEDNSLLIIVALSPGSGPCIVFAHSLDGSGIRNFQSSTDLIIRMSISWKKKKKPRVVKPDPHVFDYNRTIQILFSMSFPESHGKIQVRHPADEDEVHFWQR